jgi:catechol 2,3-dioxygenase-like lactoylglutathione lyase family enzyme
MFTKMDHAAVCVSDMARSIAFYRDALGFEQVFDRVFDEGMARILGVPEAEARIVHMRLGDGVVELFDYRTPPGQPREAAPQWAYGVTHIGLRVEGFWPAYEALQARGVPFLGEPTEIRPQVWVAYFCGPDGEVLEMRELP